MLGRRSTGLRNRYRSGAQSGYARKRKARNKDTYGEYNRGHCVTPDIIAGHVMTAIDPDTLKGDR